MKNYKMLFALISSFLLLSCGDGGVKSEVFTVNGVSFEMIYIKGGTYMMGSLEGSVEAEEDEFPAHSVTVNDFFIGECEVTQELWEAVMGNNPSGFKDNPMLPVESVNWFECKAFIDSLNKLTGKVFRLPTEAEWEFAARGGNNSQGFIYSGSDSIDSVAWYKDNGENCTKPVKQKLPNELGLYDMSGNVWEWCSDWYGNYPSESVVNPTGNENGYMRVMRGGSWLVAPEICRVADRSHGSPKGGGCIAGLRLAL